MPRYAIIGLDSGQIVIIGPVIACRPPFRLSTYVDIDADLDLCVRMSKGKTQYTGGENWRERFHKLAEFDGLFPGRLLPYKTEKPV